MVVFSGSWLAVINALAQASGHKPTPDELATHLGWSLTRTYDVLCDLDLARWIDVVESDDGIDLQVSLAARCTPWRAYRALPVMAAPSAKGLRRDFADTTQSDHPRFHSDSERFDRKKPVRRAPKRLRHLLDRSIKERADSLSAGD